MAKLCPVGITGPRHDDDLRGREDVSEFGNRVQTVSIRQADVEIDDGETPGLCLNEAFRERMGADDVVPPLLYRLGKQFRHYNVVIDDQDPCHVRTPVIFSVVMRRHLHILLIGNF